MRILAEINKNMKKTIVVGLYKTNNFTDLGLLYMTSSLLLPGPQGIAATACSRQWHIDN